MNIRHALLIYSPTGLYDRFNRCQAPIESDPRFEIVDRLWDDYGAFGDNNVLFTQPRLNAAEVKRAYRKAIRSFYLRPSFFLKTIRRIRTWEQVKGYLRGLMAVILAR